MIQPSHQAAALPLGEDRSGGIVKLASILGFLWLALSVATIYLLAGNGIGGRLNLVEWAAVVAAVSTPLALIGMGAIIALRIQSSRNATLVGQAQSLFDNASAAMRGEMDGLRLALESMRADIIAQRAEVDQQASKLLAAGDGFSRQVSTTAALLNKDAASLADAVTALDRTAAEARVDLGVIMADLPRMEALAASVAEGFRTAGGEAHNQAGLLEASLAQIASRSSTAQEAATTATGRLAAQIAQIEGAAERAREQLESMAVRLNESVDSALTRTADAVETTRSSIALQNEALLGTVDAARAALTDTGSQAVRGLSDSIGHLSGQFGELERVIGSQDDKVRGLIAQLGTGLVELEAQLGALGSAGEAQTTLLSGSIETLRQKLEAMSGPIGQNEQSVAGLIEQMSALREMLDGMTSLAAGELPEKLSLTGGLVSQTRATLSETGTEIAGLEERIGQLKTSVEAVRQASEAGVSALDQGLSGAEGRIAALVAEAEESRNRIQAIEAEADDVGFKASATLLDALTRAREASAQAAEHIRAVLSGVTDETQAALARANEETLRSAVDEALAGRIAALKDASEQAVEAAQGAAERLARQMLTIADTTASVEARIAEVNTQVEQQNQEEFSRRSALLIESLNSCAIDIGRVLSNEVADTAWAAYLKGDRSVFARRAVRLLDSGDAKAIQRHYEQETDFRDQVNRYVHDFEAVIRRVLAERDGGPMAVAMLSSDVGKLYVALAQAIERLRDS